jgi:hypothetical protein
MYLLQHLSIAKKHLAHVAPLLLLAFVMLQLHLLLMLLKQRQNTHCLVFIQQALVTRIIILQLDFSRASHYDKIKSHQNVH